MTNENAVVYKYFDLIDGFIRVRALSGEDLLKLPATSRLEPPDRREYRRLVVRACVVGLDDVVLPRVQQIYPEDATAAEDLLYQICVDVNPRLEIHTVSLPADEEESEVEQALEHSEDFRERAIALEERVLDEVVGQDGSVRRICQAIRKAACGLNDPARPIGTFLLVGRSGTGKTELAKSMARNLFGAQRLIRVDCSEFALPHETAKLIGAPPGYVGHNDGGVLTEALAREPASVVLFDEVEKGHEKLHNMLLQILDEGRLTDSKGKTVHFHQAVVLMTSNVGTMDYAEASNRIGFDRRGLGSSDFRSLTEGALKRYFKPELLNRLDAVLTFDSLDPLSLTRIAEMRLQQLSSRMAQAGIRLNWTRSLPGELARLGYSEEYGAREIRRTVDRLVEDPLAAAILAGRFASSDSVQARWKDGDVMIEKKVKRARKRSA